jgi:glycerol kinase
VPAFVGLGAPHWDPNASGLLIGLRRSTRPGHIARAALESIAFQVAEVAEAMESDSRKQTKQLRVDGGAAVNNLLLQIQSDLLGIPVMRPAITETTALGAAYLAGLAVGLWSDAEHLRAPCKEDSYFTPKISRTAAAAARARWRKAVERSKRWSEEES